ncbi:unnamed protein product, partial [Lymnaea stagnalis]
SVGNTLYNSSVFDTLITQKEFIPLIGMYTSVDLILSSLGLITNAVNIRTFQAMGVNDGITVSFLFLSASEVLCSLAGLGQRLSMAFWLTEMATGYHTWFHINPYAFIVYFMHIRSGLFQIPVLITTYMAVVKCMCVVNPLGFKNTFSVAKTVKIMVWISMVSFVTSIPNLATMGVVEVFDQQVNVTRPTLWFPHYRDIVRNIVWNGRDSVSAITSEIVIVVCLVVMTRSLSKAVSVREGLKSGGGEGLDGKPQGRSGSHGKIFTGKLKGKELQVIRQVTYISLVYIVGNTPKIIVYLAIALVPGLTQGGLYKNLYNIIIIGKESCELVISCVNIVIYYKYNTKFRACCLFRV